MWNEHKKEQSIEDVAVEDHDYEVFISYRHRRPDGTMVTEAEALYAALWENYAITAFRDQEELHFGDFRRQLIRYNKQSRCLVLLLTPGALDRCKVTTGNGMEDWVSKEISLFLRRHKRIIPVVFPGFEWPTKDELPKELHGVLKVAGKSIRYTDAADVADQVHDFLRRRWSCRDKQEAIKQREYITRHYREKTGSYFCESAMRFRKELLFFALMLWFASMALDSNLAIVHSQDGWAFLYAWLAIFFLYFGIKTNDYGGRKVTAMDVLLDHSLAHIGMILDGKFVGMLFLSVIIYAAGVFLNIVTCASVGEEHAIFEATNSMFITCSLVRFGHRSLWSALHLLNSLLSSYPRIYLRKKKIHIAERVFGIIGWVLLVPFAFFITIVSMEGL